MLVLWLHPIFSFQRMIANTVRTVKFCRSQSFSKCITTSVQSALSSVATVITTNSVCTRTEEPAFQCFFRVWILWCFVGWNILQEVPITPFSSISFPCMWKSKISVRSLPICQIEASWYKPLGSEVVEISLSRQQHTDTCLDKCCFNKKPVWRHDLYKWHNCTREWI